MKKILSLAMAVCFVFLLSVPAFADGRGPAFTEYNVVCTKETPYYQENWDKDGVMEKQGSFPAGTTLEVRYEYENGGVTYGLVGTGSEDDMKWVYIRVSDVDLQNDIYQPEKSQKLSRPRTVRVYVGSGVPMYAGPNTKYSKIATVPYGTKLTYTYGNDADDEYRTWAYVKYLGKTGWIYVYAGDRNNGVVELPEPEDRAEILVLKDGVKMYSGMSFGNIEDNFRDIWNADEIAKKHEEPDRVVGTLKKGKTYTYRYSHAEDYYGVWYNVRDGLRTGWVYCSFDSTDVAVSTSEREKNTYIAFRTFRLKLLESPDPDAKATEITVKSGTVLEADYAAMPRYDTYYHTTIDGQSGWFSTEGVSYSCACRVEEMYIGRVYADKNYTDSAAPIYADAVSMAQTVGTIPSGSAFTPLFHGCYNTSEESDSGEYVSFYFVRYNGVTGWVNADDVEGPSFYGAENETDDVEEEPTDVDAEETEPTEEEPAAEETEPVEETEPEDETADAEIVVRNSMSPLQIVLICVGGAVVLALTAAVTLVLIRRKRKSAPNTGSENN